MKIRVDLCSQRLQCLECGNFDVELLERLERFGVIDYDVDFQLLKD